MKILALGGSGGMGRYAVHSLYKNPKIEKIFVADLNASSAKDFSSSFNNKVDGFGLDVTNESCLLEAMSKVDIVINTTGPFFKFAELILRTAIETNCHYFDICDDWEPTEKMFLMDQKAKSAGITAIIGLGASPGLTNILAYMAMLELDEISKVYTGWDISSAKTEQLSSQKGVNAAMVHGIEQIIGKVKVFKEGKYQMVRPLNEVKIHYPEIGEFKANIFGHPEAITFPHHYPHINESLNLMHGEERGFNIILKFIRFLIEAKILTKKMAARILTYMEGLNTSAQKKEKICLPAVFGYAEGTKNGKKISIGVTIDKEIKDLSMGEATSFPLVSGVKMLIDGLIDDSGVHAPESGIIDPKLFINYFAREIGNGIKLFPKITRSQI